MSDYDFLTAVYDILSQNDVGASVRDEITGVIDHVDYDGNEIVFRLGNGREFELRLTEVK